MTEALRFVLDLRVCQRSDGGAERGAHELRFARAFVEAARGHEVLVAAAAGLPRGLPWVREQFHGLLPPERVVAYSLPWPSAAAAGGAPWRTHAAAAVRRAFFEWVGADLVHESDWTGWPEGAAPGWLPPPGSTPVVRAATIWPGDPAPATTVDVLVPPGDDPESAVAALAAFTAAVVRRRSVRPFPPARPSLAVVTPLPPERTGIADHVVELLPALAEHYDVEVVVAQERVDDPWVVASVPVRSVGWFDLHADRFDRIVYQLGNSHFHSHMFGLLARHPGVVVLHELLLSGAVEEWARASGLHGGLRRALYSSHGYAALLTEQREGHAAAALRYPCSGDVVAAADGVITHSEFARGLVTDWYGARVGGQTAVVPLCRVAPILPSRSAARRRLGIGPEEFLCCSFGFVGRAKLGDRLLEAWGASDVGEDVAARLAYVGGLPADSSADPLRRSTEDPRWGGRVHVTGFVDQAGYRDYLAAADVAVQLRGWSGGETSAAVLDCLAARLPTVVNAAGWAAELPDDAVVMLPREVAAEDLAAALDAVRADPARRAALGEKAADHVRVEHSPRRSAAAYRNALERFAATGDGAVYRRLLASMTDGRGRTPRREDLVRAATGIAAARPRRGLRQLLVDVSELADTDRRTGVERVSRAVLKALLEDPPAGYRVEPVRTASDGLRYARAYTHALLGIPAPLQGDDPIEAAAGDRFLGLDLAYNTLRLAERRLSTLRDRGVRLDFVVYDLLPVLRRDCFPGEVPGIYTEWLRSVTRIADGVVCISETVSTELLAWLETAGPQRDSALDIGYFRLGADVAQSVPTTGGGRERADAQTFAAARPTFLMVGTVEPRKGHGQVLDAMSRLWDSGAECGLLVVGKEGWDVTQLSRRLRTHEQRGRRLLWLDRASDEVLLSLYGSCAALLAASEGEGFGLPLVEAAQHGLPIVARDIPVFHEVAGEHAFFFRGTSPEALSEELREWLTLYAAGEAPSSVDMPWLTWAESTRELVECLSGNRWKTRWRGQRS
jgi:glycosyltransferase involved in cell wall biosynthesis